MSNSHPKVAVITGAGSGIGRAVALKLSQEGWAVALLGRRPEPLSEVASECGPLAMPCPCDIGNAPAVAEVIDSVQQKHGRIDALVNCAGINVPQRALEVLSVEDYEKVIQTNLNGAFYCVSAVLPIMRKAGGGTVVNINSEAGRLASAKSGASYVVSKFGMTGLSQSINAEERHRGIRATSIFPGDVNTPLLDKRPQPPPAEARAKMVQPEDVAECAFLAINLPPRAIIEELVVRPA